MPERIWPTTDPRELEERKNCSACVSQRFHTELEWKNHPMRGQGRTREWGFSHPAFASSVETGTRS